MKVGIISLAPGHNFGGILQLYALQEFLIKHGHEVIVFDRQRNISDENIGSLAYNFICRKLLYRNINSFVKKHLRITNPIRSDQQLKKLAADCDAVIVGSDQVWRLSMVKKIETNFFLDFVPEQCTKIAYSASFGTNKWEGTDAMTNRIIPLIKRFKAISIRESDGIDICHNIFNVDAIQTLDPVLLHSTDFYINHLLQKKGQINDSGLFYYFLANSPLHKKAIDSIAKTLNLRPYTVNYDWKFKIGKFEFSHCPLPNLWVDAIRKSKFVITDSFHGVAFSILFRKPFIVVSNALGGMSRIESILSTFHLQSRLVNFEQIQDLSSNELLTIDFNQLMEILSIEKKKSMQFIFSTLQEK